MTESAIWVEIIEARGSTPRDAGTAMKVTLAETKGTIGGGALEYQAIAEARSMLASGTSDKTRRFALGPALGQCCGGAVTLRFGRAPRPVDKHVFQVSSFQTRRGQTKDLWLWGAGHVGQAVVLASPPQAFRITWVDESAQRFPVDIPSYATVTPALDMPRLAARAPKYAHHLIFTYSHDIDFALCHTLLQRGAGSVGVIGSATKWARFRSRLAALGHSEATIDQINCPIGDVSLGKHPQAIAAGVVASLLAEQGTRAAQEDVA